MVNSLPLSSPYGQLSPSLLSPSPPLMVNSLPLSSPYGQLSPSLLPLWSTLSLSPSQELNSHLSTRVFIVGTRLSLADIILYYGLHRYMVCIGMNTSKTRGVHRTLTPRSQTLFHRLGTIPVEWE